MLQADAARNSDGTPGAEPRGSRVRPVGLLATALARIGGAPSALGILPELLETCAGALRFDDFLLLEYSANPPVALRALLLGHRV